MIEATIERWHQHLRGQLPGGLDALLHDDVVFYSPVVFTPQRGKEVTKLYLQAAAATFPGNVDASPSEGRESGKSAGNFRYTHEAASGNFAALEFETQVDGKHINGIDLITCDDAGLIIEFKVMLRPLQAVNLMHQKMGAMLASMQEAAAS